MKTGTQLYDDIDILAGSKREAYLLQFFTSQPLPGNLKEIPIVVSEKNSKGEDVTIQYSVLSDYLSGGTTEDSFRTPLTPTTAQKIADYYQCILPTKKMVDQIWKAATVKLTPRPISPKKGEAGRESSITYRKHHRMIEDQLVAHPKDVLIAGHKKDVIIGNVLATNKGKVVIYGWQYSDGKSIQPVFAGHSAAYVDYSHGIRLIKQNCLVNGQSQNIKDVLKNKELAHLLSHEGTLRVLSY